MNEYVPVDAVISVVVAISPNYTTATTVIFLHRCDLKSGCFSI